MNDGEVNNNGIIISTYNNEHNEIKILQTALENKFELKFQIFSRLGPPGREIPLRGFSKKKGYIIYIPKNQLPLLSSIIYPYIIVSMRYKLKVNKTFNYSPIVFTM
jgi:hypothetical protein